MFLHHVVLSCAILVLNPASASASSSSDQRTSQHQSKVTTFSTRSSALNSTSITSTANSIESSWSAVAGDNVGAEVASKVLAILPANPASQSTDASPTIFSGSVNKSSTALFSPTPPSVSLAQASSLSKSAHSDGFSSTENSSSISFSFAEKASASASRSRTHAAATSSKFTSSSASAFSPTQAPSHGSSSQASETSSVLTTANNNGTGTTITSPPAGFSTSTASNPLWTSDTTTVINGTIFPVWYLGKHTGIVLEGIGGKTDDPVRPGCSGLFRSFIGCGTWIKLPGFGTFKISSNGAPVPQDTPTDPIEPGDPGNDQNPDDPDDSGDQDKSAEITSHAHERTSLNSEERTPSTTLQSRFKTTVSTRPSSSHSNTRSEASTKSSTVSTRSPSSYSSTRTTASRSTASHSGSASASATTTNYIIRLKPAISTTQLEDLSGDVKAHAPNMYSISLGSRPNDTVICAKLNGSSFALFNDDPLVSSVLLDQKVILEKDQTVAQTASNGSSSARSRLSKRLIVPQGAYSYQSDPFVPELNFISEPPGTYLARMANFKFPATAGEGVDVYVPDSGGNTAHQEFVDMKGKYRWLTPPEGTWPGSDPWAPNDPTGHGTCIADKVAGYKYGVAKNANIVFLRIPIDDEDDIFNSGMLLVFQMMVTDIKSRKKEGYAKLPVVSISWGTTTLSAEFTEILFQAISNLMDQGTVLIIASGNDAAKNYNVNAWPGLARERIDSIILTGAVNNDGEEAPFSQGGYLVDVWAPGVDITCATGSGSDTKLGQGTSIAAPEVAGVATILMVAYELQTPQQVKEHIVALAHPRNGGPDAVYVGNPGDFCRTQRKRAARWDRRTVEEGSGNNACEAELFSATVTTTTTLKSTVSSVTRSTSVRTTSLSTFSSSATTGVSPQKTSSALAAVKTASKSSCDPEAWYGDEVECDARCPQACTEVVDGFSNAFPSFVCECKS